MAFTDFGALAPDQLRVWSKRLRLAAWDNSFVKRLTGADDNSIIQIIEELTKTDSGLECVIPLVADLSEDGQTGDNQREGNEEDIKAYYQKIHLDILTHSVKNKGRKAERQTVIPFRKTGLNMLGRWLGNRMDQIFFLASAGVTLNYKTDGSSRTRSNLPDLAFAADIKPFTSKRHFNWHATNGLVAADTTAIATANNKFSYDAVVEMNAYAKAHYIRPQVQNGKEFYHYLVHPQVISALKRDQKFVTALAQGQERGKDNPIFTGALVTVDGAVFHNSAMSFNTLGLASGSKWGSAGAVDGSAVVLMGAQFAGLGEVEEEKWVEKNFDYDSKLGINVEKLFGLLIPQYPSFYDGTTETFGGMRVNVAL